MIHPDTPLQAVLKKSGFHASPIEQFRQWYTGAVEAGVPQPNAMGLATADEHGAPSLRMVLFKGVEPDGFRFFTNYSSKKARDLSINPKAALLFYWEPLGRQVRITGPVERLPGPESDEYFNTRGRNSQIGAWASRQSEPITNRTVLEHAFADYSNLYDNRPVPRPQHWGGYRLAPERMEFWQNGPDRLHDRICYTLTSGSWRLERLSP